MQNVVLTPHVGYVTEEAYHIFFRQVVENILSYLDGQLPPRALNPEAMKRRAAG
jgi:D-3-phosphoglycerate dehydrogenase